MKPNFEKVTSGVSAFRVFERSDPAFPFAWHYHPEYELTLILDSHGQRLVGDGVENYEPGDLVLVGPNLPHSWRSGPMESSEQSIHRAVVVQFRPDFLGDRFFELAEMESVNKLLQRAANGLAFGHDAAGHQIANDVKQLPTLPEDQRLITLLSILVKLAAIEDARPLSSLKLRLTSRPADQRRIDALCLYLNENFHEEIQFSEIAKLFHTDQASLCRFFKRATGRTMSAYLTELRIAAAAQLLQNTDASLLDICFQVGFGNYSNFHRQFKRLKGHGPRTLRLAFSPENPGTNPSKDDLRLVS